MITKCWFIYRETDRLELVYRDDEDNIYVGNIDFGNTDFGNFTYYLQAAGLSSLEKAKETLKWFQSHTAYKDVKIKEIELYMKVKDV